MVDGMIQVVVFLFLISFVNPGSGIIRHPGLREQSIPTVGIAGTHDKVWTN